MNRFSENRKNTYIILLSLLLLFLPSCSLMGEEQKNEVSREEAISQLYPVSIEEQIRSSGDEELENRIPGVFSVEKVQFPRMRTGGKQLLLASCRDTMLQCGRVYNTVADHYEYRVMLIGEDNQTEEFCLEELPEDYILEDLQLYEDVIAVFTYPAFISDSQNDNGMNGTETELWLYDYSGRLLFRDSTAAVLGCESKKNGTASLLMADGCHPWILDYSTGELTELLADGTKCRTVQAPVKQIDTVLVLEDGLIFVAYADQENLILVQTDPQGQEILRTGIHFPGLRGVYAGDTHELLLMNENSLYGITTDFQEATELIQFTSYGIDYMQIVKIRESETGKLEILTCDLAADSTEEMELHSLVPYNSKKEQAPVLTIACLQSTELLRYAVNMFNQADLGIQAELKIYYDRMQVDASPEDVLQKFNSDILDGTAGDVICFTGLEHVASRTQYAASGVFVDLNKWMDSDTEFHREDYFTSVWEANEIDGVLINLVPLFSINTMIAAEEQYGKIPCLEDLVDQDSEQIGNVFGTGYLRSAFLHDLCLYLLNHPEDKKSLLYRTDSLEKYLEIVRELPEADFSDGGDDIVNIHIGRKQLYQTYGANVGGMGRFLSQLRLASAFFEKEDYDESDYVSDEGGQSESLFETWGTRVHCTGLPMREGNGSSIKSQISFGILESSDKKDIAWRFLKNTLEEEYQKGNQTYQYYTIPVNKSVFFGILDQIDQNNGIDPVYGGIVGSGIMEEEIAVTAPIPFLSQWMLEEAASLIESIAYVDETDPEVEKIVLEEAERFLSGTVSAYEAAKRIGERVRLYMEE